MWIRVAHRVYRGDNPLLEVPVEIRDGCVSEEQNILLTDHMSAEVYRAVKHMMDESHLLDQTHFLRSLLMILALVSPTISYGVSCAILSAYFGWTSDDMWKNMLVCYLGVWPVMVLGVGWWNVRYSTQRRTKYAELARDVNESYATGGAAWQMEHVPNTSLVSGALANANSSFKFKLDETKKTVY